LVRSHNYNKIANHRLLLQVQVLEDAFYHAGHLGPVEWHALSERFARCGRHFRAAYTLEKLGRLEGVSR
jgi:hypothetical protein